MGHRVNERNSGHWSVDGEPKARKTSSTLTPDERELTAEILRRVISVMEYDPILSERGRLHPDAVFSDGGRFILSLRGEQINALYSAIEKLDR